MARIRCPHCGSSVSSLAFTCPACNVPIKGNVRQCPDCHEWLFATETRCEHCGCELTSEFSSAATQASSGLLSATSQAGNTGTTVSQVHRVEYSTPGNSFADHRQEVKKSGGCMKALVILLLFVILFAAAAFGGYTYYEYRNSQRKAVMEELARRIAEDEKANARQLVIAQADSAAWHKAIRNRSMELTEKYIAEYPEGIFINEAYMLLEELKKRKVSESEQNSIRLIVDTRLNAYQKKRLGKKDKDVLGLHYSVDGELRIQKKYINRDSFQYVVCGNISETITRTDPTKPTSSRIKMEMLLNATYKVLESSI